MKRILSFVGMIGLISPVYLFSMYLSADDHNSNEPKVNLTKVRDHVYMIVGRGGNIGLSVGDDGVFMIDDQYANMTKGIEKAIKSLSSENVEFLINTHYHGDHTGGNENFGKKGAIIVAHDKVRERLSSTQVRGERKTPPLPEIAQPEVTYNDKLTIYRNGDQIKVTHFANAHTDGDSIVYFVKANVLHTGDIFFNGFYPFVDVDGGGSIDGLIYAVESMIEMINEDTKIIPGHGPLTDRATFKEYLAMLKEVRSRFQKLIDEGKTVVQVLDMKPTKDLDEKWGKGFMRPQRFNTLIYRSLTEKKD